MKAIYKRELKSYFQSMIGYAFIAFLLAFVGIYFMAYKMCIRDSSNGGGSAEIKALYEITPLMGVKTLLGGNAEVKFVPGYVRDEKQEVSDTNWQETSLENGGGSAREQSVNQEAQRKRAALRQEAAELAAQYEYVLFVGGLNHEHDSEGNDRVDMKLPYEQDKLIQELLLANPNTCLLYTSRCV